MAVTAREVEREEDSQLTLLEAFRQLGPLQVLPEDPDADDADQIQQTNHRRQSAARQICSELETFKPALVRRFSGREDLVDDAIQLLLVALAGSGPRGEKPNDPSSEAAVRGYLRNALRNNVLSYLRREEKEAPLAAVDPVTRPSEGVVTSDLRIDLQQAKTRLFREIVPAIADGKRTESARASFLTVIEQLRSMAEGQTDFESVILSELSSPAGETAVFGGLGSQGGNPSEDRKRKRAVNRLHQRYSRALAEVSDAVTALAGDNQLTEDERDNLIRWVDWLRLGDH